MTRIEFESLMKVINYIREDELKHYEECEEPDTTHIWNDIKVLIDYAQVHQFTLENLDKELASERRRDKAGQDACYLDYLEEQEAKADGTYHLINKEGWLWEEYAKEERDGELPMDNDTFPQSMDDVR